MVRNIARILALMVLFTASAGTAVTATPAMAQVHKAEKIVASYIVAFGRTPAQGELNWWMGQPEKSVDGYVAGHRSFMANQSHSERRETIKRSYQFAMNRQPSQAEISWHEQHYPTSSYAERVAAHTRYIDQDRGTKRSVIIASYRTAMGRSPSEGEINYWMQFSGQNFSTLVARHHQWMRENGISRGVRPNASLSSAVRSEIRRVSGGGALTTIGGEVAWGGGPSSAVARERLQFGGRIISTGGGNIISTGGGNIIATGGGNLIGHAGGT